MRLLTVEVRRALRRRLVWVLIAVAIAGILLIGVIAFTSSAGRDLARLRTENHPAIMASWWVPGGADGALTIGAFFLLMGGLIGGASVVGAEWRAGTMTTVLTWEPRRVRLFLARVVSAVSCAIVIAVLLQALFLLALLPAVYSHGTTSGFDRDLAISVGAAIVRIAGLTGLATGIGACLSFVMRNTAGAIVCMWAWISIIEALARANRPKWTGFLLGDNITRVLTWNDLEGSAVSRAPAAALALLLTYMAVIGSIAAFHLQRSDIAST
jgi:hypothetical protein